MEFELWISKGGKINFPLILRVPKCLLKIWKHYVSFWTLYVWHLGLTHVLKFNHSNFIQQNLAYSYCTVIHALWFSVLWNIITFLYFVTSKFAHMKNPKKIKTIITSASKPVKEESWPVLKNWRRSYDRFCSWRKKIKLSWKLEEAK